MIAQEIPEVQGEGPPRVVPQKRVQQHTALHFVDVPVPQVIPQERFSERIQGQIVDVPVPQVIPQERFSERIEGQIVDVVPCMEQIPGRGNSSSAAVPLDTAEWAGDRGFRTFSPEEKSAKSRRQSTAMLSHCQPSTGAADEVEFMKYSDVLWARQWEPQRQRHSWQMVDT